MRLTREDVTFLGFILANATCFSTTLNVSVGVLWSAVKISSILSGSVASRHLWQHLDIQDTPKINPNNSQIHAYFFLIVPRQPCA